MNPISLVLGAIKAFTTGGGVSGVIDILRGLGVLKDPEAEKELRAQLAQQHADWVKMTTPPWERVGLWANTFVAISRPGMAWVLLLALVFFPSRLLQAIGTLHEAGSLGLAVIAILLWAYFGRSMEKGVELWFTALAMKWGGPQAASLMPKTVATLPPPTVSSPTPIPPEPPVRVDDPDVGRWMPEREIPDTRVPQ